MYGQAETIAPRLLFIETLQALRFASSLFSTLAAQCVGLQVPAGAERAVAAEARCAN